MMKRFLKRTVAILALCAMLLPQSVFAEVITYSVEVSITGPDKNGGISTVSGTSSRYGALSDNLMVTVATVILTDEWHEEVSTTYPPYMSQPYEALIDAAKNFIDGQESAWDYWADYLTNCEHKDMVKNRATALADLVPLPDKTIYATYKSAPYSVTIKLLTNGENEERPHPPISGGTGTDSGTGVCPYGHGEDCVCNRYTDVYMGHIFHEAADYVVSHGIMIGKTATYFDFLSHTNRQQVWMVLARLAGENPSTMGAARMWAMRTGVSDGTNPTKSVTRQQLAAMIYRYNGSPAVQGSIIFIDAQQVADYARPAVTWCTQKGIIGGYADSTFRPMAATTRGAMAAMFQRYCQKVAHI